MQRSTTSRCFRRQGFTRRAGVSAAALGAALAAIAMTPGTAAAQATPGSPQCPVVNDIVTCSGALPGGVAVTSGPYRGLTVSNVSGDMAAANRPVIEYRTDQPNTTILLDDPDSAVRLTTSGNPGDSLLGAIQALLPQNGSFSLTSNLDVFVTEASGTGQRMQPFGILVAGEGGTFTIQNSGDVEMRDIDFAPDSASILIDVFGADLVSLTNSGDLTQVNSDVDRGIVVAADNRRVEIVNSGDILMPGNNGFTGIELAYQPTRFAPPAGGLRDVTPYTGVGGSLSYNAAPVMALESYSIRNSGLISVEGFGIYVNTSVVDQTGTGIGALGAPDGSIVNDGTVRATFGLAVSHTGDRSIVNNGRLENFDDDEFFGIYVTSGFRNVDVPSTVRVENGSAGVIEYDGTFIAWGIDVSDDPATIVNAGRISMLGGEFNRGIEVSGFAEDVGLTTIENSGTIQVASPNGWGILTNFSARPTGAFSDTRINNSGLIESTGAGGRALHFFHRDLTNDPGGAQRGRVALDLAATSVVRGGSGDTGAAIVFEGGESHSILNRGLITAASGRAIVGGTAAETLDSSGRIEGSVVLGAGNDAVTMGGGSVQIGALDGGADSDSLLFDIATGEASVTGPILNFETVRKTGSGTLTLRDTGTISPGFSFEAGTLLTGGDLGTTAIAAPTGTTFGGSGRLGAVTIADGATISPGGTGIGTLTVASLSLSNGSRLRYDLGVPGRVGGADNDLIDVTGNLVLDGTLDVVAAPGFGDGVYRLFNYGGTLTDNGLAIGTAPDARYSFQTALAGQVNLVVGIADFWDGGGAPNDNIVSGGTGIWNSTNINWTNSSGTFNAPFSGNTAVFQGAAGVVTVEGAQSANGLQFVTSGYRVVAGAGGQIVLGAAETAVRVDSGATAELAVTLAGSGRLVKRDTGTLLLTGVNSYTGGTSIREGVLQISADTALGAPAGGLTLDGGTLRTAGSFGSARAMTVGAGGGTIDVGANTLTLSGTLAGTGPLVRTGAGTLAFSGNGSAYTGTLRVSGGILNLTGTLGGSVTVDAGARLTGTGTLGSVAVAGTLSPGGAGSVGTLTATGNVSFAAGSVFEVDITEAGGFDRLLAGGTATLSGGTVSALFSGFSSGAGGTCGSSISAPILTAQGGVTGTFAGVTSNSAFLTPTLSYDSKNVFLNLTRNAATFTERGETANQKQSAGAAEALACGAPLFDALVVLDAASARAAFDRISGEIHASARSALLDDSRFLRDALRSATAAEERPTLWGQAYGSWGDSDGNGNAAAVDRDGRGLFAGIDVPLGASFAAALGGGFSRADYVSGARGSSAEVDSRHVAARLTGRFGGFTAMLGGGYSWHNVTTQRTVAFAGFADQAGADYDARTEQAFAELRYSLDLGSADLEPFVSLAHVSVEADAFEEEGGAAALSGDAGRDRATFTTVGLRGAAEFGAVRLRGSLGWRHAFSAEASRSTMLFAGGDTPFTVAGAAIDEDAADASIGVEIGVGGRARLGAAYTALIGERTQAHGVRAEFTLPF
ncbi:MAG TPA: autotransporter domain-containing protein [Allosphingosinicella sp.]|jgi:outer membrane autotransporter protein